MIQDGHCLSMSQKFKKCHKDCISETFFLVEKTCVGIDGGWIQEEDEVMVQFDLPCIFGDNKSEEFQHFLERVDVLANPDPVNALL